MESVYYVIIADTVSHTHICRIVSWYENANAYNKENVYVLPFETTVKWNVQL